MKRVVRITQDEAKILNVKTWGKEKGRTKSRVSLDEDQLEQLNEIRHGGVYAYCQQ